MKRTVFALVAAAFAAGVVFFVLKMKDPGEVSTEATVPAAAPALLATAPIPALVVAPQTEFQKKLDGTQDSLPTSQNIQALPAEQVHNTPQPLINASLSIGEIAEAVSKNPELGAQGMDFYGKCSRRGELAVSVRAHCLHNLRALGKTRGEKADEAGIASGVLKLEGPFKE